MAASWLERLVRWLERPEGDAAIWVRDYRLDDATARRVVELIRTGAREQGLEVGRIVINARELWRAPTPKALEEY
ncbi:hypothetical protein [Marilutibacter alkalisoli]|uniref:Uncharacterized protein n=1 Tax=Marilutibacter alkalisoli TaxID=2591633 RepID=A0A514BRW9_9GAMM|nr:hypothetical protein [Lysobacter alkalisoli]QDH70142.1 hypothetical protein FKV23_08575 [Lysobacter alkalisoli]